LEIQLTGMLVVAVGGFGVPLGLGFVTSLRLPSVVLEIVVGILIGPVVLRLVEIDAPLRILSLFMLAFHTAALAHMTGEVAHDSGETRSGTTASATLSRKPSGCMSGPAGGDGGGG
jgi:hypothetical protein